MSHTSLAFLFLITCSVLHPSCGLMRLPEGLCEPSFWLAGLAAWLTGCVSLLRSFINAPGFVFGLGLQ